MNESVIQDMDIPVDAFKWAAVDVHPRTLVFHNCGNATGFPEAQGDHARELDPKFMNHGRYGAVIQVNASESMLPA